MASLNFVCFISSVRDGRMADRMKKLVQSQFDKILTPKGHTLQFIGKSCFQYYNLSQIVFMITILHFMNFIFILKILRNTTCQF